MLQPHPNPRFASLIAIALVLVLAAGAIAYIHYTAPQSSSYDTTPLAAATATPTPFTSNGQTVTIYTKTITETNDTATQRTYPTKEVYRQVGASGTAELLTTVGKVGEYPDIFKLSPDSKTLYISLESKLMALDLSTKTLTQIYTAKHAIGSFVFSQDGKAILIWDETYAATTPSGYTVVQLTLADDSIKTITQGDSRSDGYIYLNTWRSDNKAVVSLGRGDVSNLGTLDLATGTITIYQERVSNYGISSRNGMYWAAYDKSIANNVCDSFSGEAPSRYAVIDPANGDVGVQSIINFGSTDKQVTPVAFITNDTAILYKESTPWSKEADCDKTPTYSYFTASLDTGDVTPITDIEAFLKEQSLPSLSASDFVNDIPKATMVGSYFEEHIPLPSPA